MKAGVFYVSPSVSLRLLLLLPVLLLAFAGFVLVIAALGAAGTAWEVRYPDRLPVLAGFLAATPSLLFAAVASVALWRRTGKRVRIERRGLVLGSVPVLLAAVLLLVYAASIDNPEHYKGQFNSFTQQWDPKFHPSAYVVMILGVSTTFPMGALAVLARLLYMDAIAPARLDRPEGFDPVGILLSERR